MSGRLQMQADGAVRARTSFRSGLGMPSPIIGKWARKRCRKAAAAAAAVRHEMLDRWVASRAASTHPQAQRSMLIRRLR